MRRRRGVRLVILVPALAIQSAWAGDSPDGDRCRPDGEHAVVRVVFEDRPIQYDRGRTRDELRNMAGKWSSPYHQIMGLTQAVPQTRLEVAPRVTASGADGTGGVCVAPDVTVHLGFEVFTIFLARDIGSDCRSRIVEDHEAEHANTWRNYYRAGARLMETRLKSLFDTPLHYRSAVEMREKLLPELRQTVAELAASIHASAAEAQRQIDSPSSYQFEANRLRACP